VVPDGLHCAAEALGLAAAVLEQREGGRGTSHPRAKLSERKPACAAQMAQTLTEHHKV